MNLQNGTFKVTGDTMITTNATSAGIGLSLNTNNVKIAYAANGTNGQTTSLASGFNFSDGDHTKATVDSSGVVKYNAKTSTISVANGHAAASGNDLATADNVADAINQMTQNNAGNTAQLRQEGCYRNATCRCSCGCDGGVETNSIRSIGSNTNHGWRR